MQLRKDIQKRKYLSNYKKDTLKHMAAIGIITSTAQIGVWHDNHSLAQRITDFETQRDNENDQDTQIKKEASNCQS